MLLPIGLVLNAVTRHPSVRASEDFRKGILWAAASSLGIAGFMVPWKMATEHGDEGSAVVVLLLAAAAFNTLILPMARSYRIERKGMIFALALALAVFTLAGNVASAGAIVRISAPLLSVIQRSEVVMVALIAWLLLGERTNLSFWAGSCFSGLGILMVYQVAPSIAHVEGLFLGLLSALAFAGMAVATRRWIASIDPIVVNALRLWLSVGFSFFFFSDWPGFDGHSWEFLSLVCLAAFCGPFTARLCIMQSLRYMEARFTALFGLTVPVLTLLLTWLVMGVVPDSVELLGGALILFGVAIPVVAEARDGALSSRAR